MTALMGRQRLVVVASMYVGYAMFMVLRMIPTVAGTSITGDESFGIDNTAWGRILAMGTVGAVLGKFVGGLSADKLGGRLTFTVGLVVTAIGVCAFAMSSTVVAFQASLFLALMAKSAGWPSMTKIIESTFPPEEYGRVWGVLATSSRVGTLVATFLLGGLLGRLSWQSLLLGTAIIGVGVAVAFFFSIKPSDPAASLKSAPPNEVGEADEPHRLDGTSLPQAVLSFFASKQFWLITLSLTALTIMWDFLLFVPLYLQQTMALTEAAASQTSSAFPLGSLISVLCGGYVFDRLSRRQTAWLMGLLLIVASACVLTFYAMPSLGLAGAQSVYLTIGLLFVFGLCVAPCYYIPMSVYSIEAGGPHSGFLVAKLDGLAFGVNAAFYYFAGGWTRNKDWGLFLLVLLGVCLLSAIMTLLFLLGEARLKTSPRTTAK